MHKIQKKVEQEANNLLKSGQTHTYVFCGKSEQIAAKMKKLSTNYTNFRELIFIKQAARLLVLFDSC